ncbi:TPA: DEAD/DEAH box helicase [Candidatus Woesearchaeota archaeon]|nr:DEAD/DEAH box helicase [Candidatus Woesearchaeota archaeon]
MKLQDISTSVPAKLYAKLEEAGIEELRPAQSKAIKAGLLEGKSLLVCTPTASGKTLVAEIGMLNSILNRKGKAIYIVPLKALASEKYNSFRQRYGNMIKVGMSIGDLDASDPYLHTYDIIVCTAEKLDSLIRHHASWIREIGIVVIDEIHLLNDQSRGPTLEILITILKQLLKDVQLVALSATIGNESELATWLDAGLVHDDWRPVELKKGIYLNGQIDFKE